MRDRLCSAAVLGRVEVGVGFRVGFWWLTEPETQPEARFQGSTRPDPRRGVNYLPSLPVPLLRNNMIVLSAIGLIIN